MVLSNLADLFSWRFHLGENRDGSSKCLKRVGFQGDEEQPSSKRPKIGLDLEALEHSTTRGRGGGSASRELVHILHKKKEAAEVRDFESFSLF